MHHRLLALWGPLDGLGNDFSNGLDHTVGFVLDLGHMLLLYLRLANGRTFLVFLEVFSDVVLRLLNWVITNAAKANTTYTQTRG